MTKPKNWGMAEGQEYTSTEPPRPTPGDPFPGKRARHGTEGGYNAHRKSKEDPCEACRIAKSHADWRRRQASDSALRNRLRAKGQSLALLELSRRHLDEYHELYDKHVNKLLADNGLEPLQQQRKKLK